MLITVELDSFWAYVYLFFKKKKKKECFANLEKIIKTGFGKYGASATRVNFKPTGLLSLGRSL